MSQLTVSQMIDAITYINTFRGKTFLIKLGGSILHSDALIASLCADLKLLIQAGIHVVIVHGGSKAINKTLSDYDITSHFIDGLRVTSKEAMHVIEMVLCGHINKQLVRQLNHIQVNAVGLSGSDNNLFLCDQYSEVHGYVGNIISANPSPILKLMASSPQASAVIPVIASVGVNVQGHPMNINADDAASHLATTLSVDKLIYLTDQDGIYDKEGELLSSLSDTELTDLIKDHTVKGGMLAKARAILNALSQKLPHVHILNGHKKHVLIEELFTKAGVGTLCHCQPRLAPIETTP